jgi:membrane fusion protein, multidrug efflux system
MDDQPNPLSLPPEAPPRRRADRADRADRPEIEVPPRHPPLPDLDEEEYGRPPGAPPPPPRSRFRRALGYLVLLLVFAALILWLVFRSGPQAPQTGRFQTGGPMPVGTATIAKGDMPVVLSGLGTVTPLAVVTVKTQINGQLTEVGFKEGQMVNKGDFLAQIDPRPYQVALEQAQAQLAKDQATLKNSQVDLKRYQTLVAQNSIARQTLDTQAATVQQNIAVVQADQAQIDTQKLNLTYCRIVAPVAGRVGLRQVDPGNFVQTSDASGIVVITQLQPISVIFTLPEDNLPAVAQRIHNGASLTATAFDRTGTVKLDTGRLDTIDNQIDTTTGTFKLRATFDNSGETLFPNQFVNIQLLVDTLHGADLIPNAAVQRGSPGTFVYVVKPDDTVAARPVTLGPGNDQNVVATKGVQPGQIVVTDGADRLKDGAKVRVANRGQGAAPPQGADTRAPERTPTAAAPGTPAAAQPGTAANPPEHSGGQHRRRSTE